MTLSKVQQATLEQIRRAQTRGVPFSAGLKDYTEELAQASAQIGGTPMSGPLGNAVYTGLGSTLLYIECKCGGKFPDQASFGYHVEQQHSAPIFHVEPEPERKLYILTSEVDYEWESLLLLTDSLEKAQSSIPCSYPRRTFSVDSYNIYEAEVGGEPVRILENHVRYDHARYLGYGLEGWKAT